MAHIRCSFLDYLTIKSLLGMGIPLMLLIWSICNGDYYTGSSQEVGYERSCFYFYHFNLKLNVWKSSLHACCNFWGLEGKYIAAQICFLFCKGACSSFVWKMTWLDLITENTVCIYWQYPYLYFLCGFPPLNSKLIHPTIYQTSPLGSPHFKCNKLKNKLILWTYFLFQTCSSYRLPHYS